MIKKHFFIYLLLMSQISGKDIINKLGTSLEYEQSLYYASYMSLNYYKGRPTEEAKKFFTEMPLEHQNFRLQTKKAVENYLQETYTSFVQEWQKEPPKDSAVSCPTQAEIYNQTLHYSPKYYHEAIIIGTVLENYLTGYPK